MRVEVQIDETRVAYGLAGIAYRRAERALERATDAVEFDRKEIYAADGWDGQKRLDLANRYVGSVNALAGAQSRQRAALLALSELGLSTWDIEPDDMDYAQRAVKVRRALTAFSDVEDLFMDGDL